MAPSKTQVDCLGQRLKEGSHSEEDLRLLDNYRGTFTETYEAVLQSLRLRGVFPTGRLKTTGSIVEKLRRESIRLSQIQDIAGCRVVVGGVLEQDRLAARLKADFPDAEVKDRRDRPSHGYRAIHVIVKLNRKAIEIQVRTSLQHLWAEVSEKASDVFDPAIKYGGGPREWQKFLADCSVLIAHLEGMERVDADPQYGLGELAKEHAALRRKITKMRKRRVPDHALREDETRLKALTNKLELSKEIDKKHRKKLASRRKEIANELAKAIRLIEQKKDESNDILDRV
jgi:putative GTP pyrophosphokinase